MPDSVWHSPQKSSVKWNEIETQNILESNQIRNLWLKIQAINELLSENR